MQIGQLFYGYGWETQLCETGFLAIFLCPATQCRPVPAHRAAAVVVVWLFRWLIVRIMLGAAAIKLRGDPCWRDLTCLVYHYETQPIPNPLSWWLHALPRWVHVAGAGFNHVVELVAPFLVLGPRRLRIVAGLCFVAFQLMLIVSGNLSFLNWLTIVPAVACFDDRVLAPLLSASSARGTAAPPRQRRRGCSGARRAALALLVGVLSINPVRNLLSPHQAMNRSYDPLHLVNTYGAFGSVGRERYEVILEGTSDARARPGHRVARVRVPLQARRRRAPAVRHFAVPLPARLAALVRRHVERRPRAVALHLVDKLLAGDAGVKPLLAVDPFPDAPPRFIRAELYRYEFTRPGDGSRDWWRRTYAGAYLRPVALDDPELRSYLRQYGWE